MWKLKKPPKPPRAPAQSKAVSQEPSNTNNSGKTEGERRGDTVEETVVTEGETLRQQVSAPLFSVWLSPKWDTAHSILV